MFFFIAVIPTITLKPSNQTIGLGATARFSCQSSGDPAPSITWYKDGAQVQPGSRYFILSNNSLVITNAVDSDKGWFTCLARNAAGSAQDKAYLFVTGKAVKVMILVMLLLLLKMMVVVMMLMLLMMMMVVMIMMLLMMVVMMMQLLMMMILVMMILLMTMVVHVDGDADNYDDDDHAR